MCIVNNTVGSKATSSLPGNKMSYTLLLLRFQLLNIWKRGQYRMKGFVHFLRCYSQTSTQYRQTTIQKQCRKLTSIIHNSFCSLIGLVEIQLKKSSSKAEIPDGAMKRDENETKLRRKAMTKTKGKLKGTVYLCFSITDNM